MVKFTHAKTKQGIYCRDPEEVKVVFHAPMENKGTSIVWIVVSGVSAALPVEESLETVLSLSQMNNKENTTNV